MEFKKNEVPSWAKMTMIVGKSFLFVDGCRYEYHLLKQGLVPDLPGYVGYPGAKFLFISEEVPAEFRRYILAHEIWEDTKFKGKPGRCLNSLKLELRDVPKNIFTRYIRYRLEFFQKFAIYVAKNRERYPDDFESEIRASLFFLETLVSFKKGLN